MKKPRKKYRPTGANPLAHLVALAGTTLLCADDILERAERLRMAVEEACAGRATQNDWRHVFDAVNMTEEFRRRRIVSDEGAIEALQETMVAIMDRQRERKTRALYPRERDALRDFAADYTAILSGVTKQQYAAAQQAVEQRVRRILAGEKVPLGVRVVEAVE